MKTLKHYYDDVIMITFITIMLHHDNVIMIP
jgi:hypothetical protein